MSDPNLINQIKSYLKANEGKFSIEALRLQLIKDGAPADAVDQAISELYGTKAQSPPPASPYLGPPPVQQQVVPTKFHFGRFFVWLSGTVLANVVGAGVCIWLLTTNLPGLMFLVAIPLVLAEIVAIVLLFRRDRNSDASGVMVGLILSPVVIFCLLFGICMLLIFQMG